MRAYSDAGNLRVKLGVSKELLDLPRKRQAADIEDGAPDPKDRIDYIEWVYQNKIAPKLEEPQDAEVVQVALPVIPEGQSEGMGVVPGERIEGRVDEPKDDTAAE